jgi:hypothetical protein
MPKWSLDIHLSKELISVSYRRSSQMISTLNVKSTNCHLTIPNTDRIQFNIFSMIRYIASVYEDISVKKTFICRLSILRERLKEKRFRDNLFISKAEKTQKFNRYCFVPIMHHYVYIYVMKTRGEITHVNGGANFYGKKR